MNNVVITGLGAITPIGNDISTFWQNLVGGVSGAGPLTAFEADDFPVRIACEVKGFHPSEYMDRKLAKRSSRSSQFAIAAARQALADAGLAIQPDMAERVGVVINTAAGGIGEMEGNTKIMLAKGPRSLGPLALPRMMPNAIACQVSLATGAKGPVLTSILACASGNYAVLEAARFIQLGEADIMLAGGSEALITPVIMAALNRMGVLSSRNNDPQHACRPFDADRDGFVCGEGAAVLTLESEEHARRRGAPIYAKVLGGSLTADAYHITAPDPAGAGAVRAMRGALRNANLAPEAVDVVFAHGTATTLNDVTETRAIRSVFGEHADRLAVSATKSLVGHTLGAAGAIAALAAVLSLREGVIPPTINYHTPDRACNLDYVPNVARKRAVDVAMVNAFGFGGQNAVLLLADYDKS